MMNYMLAVIEMVLDLLTVTNYWVGLIIILVFLIKALMIIKDID